MHRPSATMRPLGTSISTPPSSLRSVQPRGTSVVPSAVGVADLAILDRHAVEMAAVAGPDLADPGRLPDRDEIMQAVDAADAGIGGVDRDNAASVEHHVVQRTFAGYVAHHRQLRPECSAILTAGITPTACREEIMACQASAGSQVMNSVRRRLPAPSPIAESILGLPSQPGPYAELQAVPPHEHHRHHHRQPAQ